MPILKHIFLLLSFAMSMSVFGHGSAKEHLADVECILNGYGDDGAFMDLFNATSSGQDGMASAYCDEFGDIMTKKFNPKTHRLLGHGWPLDGDIPKSYLEILEKEYGVPREKTIAFWRKYQKAIVDRAMKATGLPKKQATAFAGLIWDLHLLGDLEPDNTVIKQVMKIDTLLNNLERHLKVVFNDRPQYVEMIMSRLHKVVADCRKQGVSDIQVVARLLMDELQQMKIGTMINKLWKDQIKLKWSLDKSINAMMWFKERVLKRTAEKAEKAGESICKKCASRFAAKKEAQIVVKNGAHVTEKQTEKALVKQCSKSGRVIKTAKGVLQKVITKSGKEYIVLSVHVSEELGAAVGAGVLTFVIDEGIAAVSYANGKMSTDEFQVETWKNVGGAVVAGLATYVVVAFALAPGGPVAIAIGVGAYIVYDIVFDQVYDAFKYRGIDFDELFGMFPTEIQKSKGKYSFDEVTKLFGYEGVSNGFEYQGASPGIEYEGHSQGLDFKRERSDKRPFEL